MGIQPFSLDFWLTKFGNLREPILTELQIESLKKVFEHTHNGTEEFNEN